MKWHNSRAGLARKSPFFPSFHSGGLVVWDFEGVSLRLRLRAIPSKSYPTWRPVRLRFQFDSKRIARIASIPSTINSTVVDSQFVKLNSHLAGLLIVFRVAVQVHHSNHFTILDGL